MIYHVEIQRTETLLFAVEANFPEEAENLALMDGEEIGSKASIETIEVRPALQENAYG